jgi:flagellar motor protein MotB
VYQVWDRAGNESAPVFADLQVNVSAREMLMAVLKIISVHETPLGLIVPLQGSDLFVLKGGKPFLKAGAEPILREVAILANAYSDVSIKLDGYSRIQPKSGADRNLSSLYAWSVYSYLVKKGNVKASRVQVRGRGRSPMFERRGVNVPLMKDGVEVILEGNGEW